MLILLLLFDAHASLEQLDHHDRNWTLGIRLDRVPLLLSGPGCFQPLQVIPSQVLCQVQ